MKFKNSMAVGFSALMCLLVVGCTDNEGIKALLKQSSRTSFQIGYTCGTTGQTEKECLDQFEGLLSKIDN